MFKRNKPTPPVRAQKPIGPGHQLTYTGPATQHDLPVPLQEALHAPTENVTYCLECDGLRVKGHTCTNPWPTTTGTYTDEPENVIHTTTGTYDPWRTY